jgi:hypothetical protein
VSIVLEKVRRLAYELLGILEVGAMTGVRIEDRLGVRKMLLE